MNNFYKAFIREGKKYSAPHCSHGFLQYIIKEWNDHQQKNKTSGTVEIKSRLAPGLKLLQKTKVNATHSYLVEVDGAKNTTAVLIKAQGFHKEKLIIQDIKII